MKLLVSNWTKHDGYHFCATHENIQKCMRIKNKCIRVILNEKKRIMQIDGVTMYCTHKIRKTFANANKQPRQQQHWNKWNKRKNTVSSCILWCVSARVRWEKKREIEGMRAENAERYLVTNIKATSNLIWSVCISFATAIFVCFWLVFVWIYALKSFQKNPVLSCFWLGLVRFLALNHKRIVINKHIQIRINEDELNLCMRFLNKPNRNICIALAIRAQNFVFIHLVLCYTSWVLFFLFSLLVLVLPMPLLLFVRKQSKLNDLIYCHLYFPFRLFVQY